MPLDNMTIVTNDNNRIIIQGVTYQVIHDTLCANGLNKSNVTVYNQPIEVKIAIVDIKNIEIEEFDGLATAGCIIGSAGLVLLLIGVIAIANSFDKPANKCQYEGLNFEPVKQNTIGL